MPMTYGRKNLVLQSSGFTTTEGIVLTEHLRRRFAGVMPDATDADILAALLDTEPLDADTERRFMLANRPPHWSWMHAWHRGLGIVFMISMRHGYPLVKNLWKLGARDAPTGTNSHK